MEKIEIILPKIEYHHTSEPQGLPIKGEVLVEQAEEVVRALGSRRVVALLAPMGTGKTTFTSALCKALGVEDTITSPTFAIVNEYFSTRWNEPIYHFDFYRLRDLDEARAIGLEDYLYSGHLCLLEWPELIESLLPADTVVVRLEELPDGSRRLTMDA